MRYLIAISLSTFLYATAAAHDNVNVGINIGFNLGGYPSLVRVPSYPVYYDPRASANYFFYDGLFWVYADDHWYQSGWYNGPWTIARPEHVPVYVLRVPVRFYRSPPAYFHGWRADAPPHWKERWGDDWEQQRSGWDRWNHHAYVAPAPLPKYQRSYSGERYPVAPQQQYEIRSQNYRYQPHEDLTKQHWQQQVASADSHSGPHPQQAQGDNGHGNPHKRESHPDNHGNGEE
jgi:hypothetical protein